MPKSPVRRTLPFVLAELLAVATLAFAAGPNVAIAQPGWKIQVALYDNPDCDRLAVGDATLLPGDVLVVSATAWPRRDVKRYEWIEEGDALNLQLISRDRGLSWQVHDGPPLPQKSFQLKDGSLLRIEWKGYEQHPVSEQTKYEQAGYFIYPIPEKKMFAVCSGFQTHVSADGGKSWRTQDIALPHRAELAGYGMATAKMIRDGTLLMPVFGIASRRHKVRSASVLRSTDSGRHWELIDVASDTSPAAVAETDIPTGRWEKPPPGVRAFDEAQVVEANRPGRVIAVVEEQFTKQLYSSISEDSGRTWSPPKPTGMVGVTPLMLRLRSGAIACAYTNRYAGSLNDRGMRVCYSHDDGRTWDTEHLAILKDDNARPDGQCLWNLVQFSDETLFASGWAAKRGCGTGPEVSYAVGFRFTEDFRTPPRVVKPPTATALPANDKREDPLKGRPGPWKAEVALYNHPNAGSACTDDAVLLDDDTLIVPVVVTWRSDFMGYDWYQVGDSLRLNLISRDRGISWQPYPGPIPKTGFRTKDGSLVRVNWLGYQQHPIQEQAQWEKKGYWLYMIPEKKSFATTGAFQLEVSRDDGQTWQSRDIALPHRAFLAGYGMHSAKMLSDGTILMPVFGYLTRRHKTYACSVVRSADGGQTWQLITLAQDQSPDAVAESDLPSGTLWAKFRGVKGFDETSLIETRKPGRVLAVIEESLTKSLYACVSEDSGQTWTEPKPTGMVGTTPLLLRLQSGAIACAYTNR